MAGSQSTPREPTHPQGGHTNSIREDSRLGFEPRTFLLQGNSATNCTIMQPRYPTWGNRFCTNPIIQWGNECLKNWLDFLCILLSWDKFSKITWVWTLYTTYLAALYALHINLSDIYQFLEHFYSQQVFPPKLRDTKCCSS